MKIDSSLAAVVTGGASGLGLATVKALRAAGAKVAIFDLNPETGEKAAAETGAIFCRCDVLSDESVDEAFAKARAAQGQERALVCCAGGGNAIRDCASRQDDRRDQDISFRQVRMGAAAEHGRHVPLHHARCRRHDDAGADRRRARRAREHRLGRCDRRTDGAGCVLGGQGRDRRHDADDRARSVARGHSRQHDSARHLQYAGHVPCDTADARSAGRDGAVPAAARYAPRNSPAWRSKSFATAMSTAKPSGLDGAIRMQPR